MADALTLAAILVRRFEGCVLRPYADSGGKWTIGYGSTTLADGTPVSKNTPPLTQAQAEALMLRVLKGCLDYVRMVVSVSLAEHEAAALASFTYNVGRSAFRQSTLLRLLNVGAKRDAAAEFQRWCTAGGCRLRGLATRRAAECAMFLGLAGS